MRSSRRGRPPGDERVVGSRGEDELDRGVRARNRVVFRFAPGVGLFGTYPFEVEPLGPSRARLTHTLAYRVEPKIIPLYPILIREYDALSETSSTAPSWQRPALPLGPLAGRLRCGPRTRSSCGLVRRRGLLPPANSRRSRIRRETFG